MDLEEAILGEKRDSVDKEIEELLKETESKTEKVSLVDREWKEISIDEIDLEAHMIDKLPEPKSVNEKRTKSTVIFQADFGDVKAAIRRDEGSHDTILVKCECSDASNCPHILALWTKVADKIEAKREAKAEKPKKEEKEVKKDDKVENNKEKVGVQKTQEMDEAKSKNLAKSGDKFASFAKEIKGKLIVLYGQPYAGKTTLVHALTQHFERTVYFKVDRNFSREDFAHIAKNVYYIDIDSPQRLLRELRTLARSPPQNTLIVVDSVTSLDSFFVPSDPTTPSPRMENARAKFADAVMQLLSFVKGQNTVIVIAHEKIRDFQSGEIVPRFNIVALRHADSLYHIVVENNKRKVKRTMVRKPVTEPDFDFN